MQPIEHPADPGWRPAFALAPRLLGRGRPDAPVLLMMRASVALISCVGAAAAVLSLVFTAGRGGGYVDWLTGYMILGAGMIGAAVVQAMVGRVMPEVGPEGMAAFLFWSTQRKILAAAFVGPLAMFTSWLAADGTLVIYGVGVSILLMVIAAPTTQRIRAWQEEVNEFKEPYSVLEALLVSLP